MTTLFSEGTKKLICGIVCEDVHEIIKDGVKKAIIKIKDRNGESVSVFFGNRPDGPAMADRVIKVGITKGTPITILCYHEDGKDNATGLDFRFKRSVWKFTTDKGDITVLFGTICGQREISETAVGVSVPVAEYNPETRSKDEYFASVAFYDDTEDEKKKYADRARKLLFHQTDGKYSNRVGAIVCGGLRENTGKNGQVYKNYTGWRVEALDYEV